MFQHLPYQCVYLFLMLDGMSDCRLMVVEQGDISRFLNAPAEDEGRYVPSDLNNRLEPPAQALLPS
jgi:hypothetical protein